MMIEITQSGLHPLITDAIVCHGNKRKDVISDYPSINDEDLVQENDKIMLDIGSTEI